LSRRLVPSWGSHRSALLLWAFVGVITACSGSTGDTGSPVPSLATDATPSEGTGHVRLAVAPEAVISKCVSVLESRTVCPRELPIVDGSYSVRTFFQSSDYKLVDISYGGPYPRLSPKNAPPRFLHVVIKSGDLERAFPFVFPPTPANPTELPKHYRKRAFAIGTFSWGSKIGSVVLAPPYPVGGLDGGHLIFRWTGDQGDDAISMHAWSPLSAAMSVLQAIVMSVP
jgi:hypothetical protein